MLFIKQLDHGARLCNVCALGLTPLHYAAKNASKKALNLILELGMYMYVYYVTPVVHTGAFSLTP